MRGPKPSMQSRATRPPTVEAVVGNLGRPGLVVASAIGWGFGLAALILLLFWPDMSPDASAYWEASRRLLAGEALYGHDMNTPGAYLYPPIAAQFWALFVWLPKSAFVWLWRALEFGALRYLAGSWQAVGLWLLVPLTLSELTHANVTFLVCAASLAAVRGRAWLAPLVGTVKFGPLVLLPYLWLRGDRRLLVLGCLAALAAVGISALVAPSAWADYFQAMVTYSPNTGGTNGEMPLRLAPSAGADFALRFGLGLGAALIAARSDRPWLAYAASVIAVPTLWTTRLVPLLARPGGGEPPRAHP